MIATRTFAVLSATVLLAGCARHSGGIASSNIPLAPGTYTPIGATKGQDCVYHLFGLIPISGSNHTRAALDVALRRYPSTDALIDITSDTYSQHFVVYGRSCISVEATAVEFLRAAD